MKLRSYPKVWNLGHPQAEDLFDGEVVVQEKIDGSQFSFGVVDGQLELRSKGAEILPETADKLFKCAVDTALDLYKEDLLPEGWIYRGEVLHKPKHNTLEYERVPIGNIILFDVDVGLEKRLPPEQLEMEGKRLDLEVVPCLHVGEDVTLDKLKELLDTESYLGGTQIEGVVIKNYNQFGRDKKTLIGKHVSEKFKEKHESDWKRRNPSKTDFIVHLIEMYRNENRWEKAVQHLRDKGELEHEPRDIGALILEVQKDIAEEEEEEIKELLFTHFISQITRGAVRGLPEWYKEKLMKRQFE